MFEPMKINGSPIYVDSEVLPHITSDTYCDNSRDCTMKIVAFDMKIERSVRSLKFDSSKKYSDVLPESLVTIGTFAMSEISG